MILLMGSFALNRDDANSIERLRAAGIELQLRLELNGDLLSEAAAGAPPWALVTCRARPVHVAGAVVGALAGAVEQGAGVAL